MSLVLPTPEDVRAAAARIEGRVRRTPVFTSSSLDERFGARLFFKCENLQGTGAFKLRGATNAVFLLDAPERGVVTHSSGNHGAALARAARDRGIPAWIVMPEGSRPEKRAAVEAYGGEVVLCPPTQIGREETAERVRSETGATLVHPYDDPAVVAGQGTATLELLEDVPDLDLLVAPIGGGGLLSGATLAVEASGSRDRVEVVGAEPEGADDAARSLAAGRIVPVDSPVTVADGLRATIGRIPFAILSSRGIRIVTVDEDTILGAMEMIWQRLKLVVEPSAAPPLAAVATRKLDVRTRRVGLVLSGGNIAFPME